MKLFTKLSLATFAFALLLGASSASAQTWSETMPTCGSGEKMIERSQSENASCPFFTQWMKKGDRDGRTSLYTQPSGQKETLKEVSKLQGWLNKYFNTGLALDGIFGVRTFTAVKTYQLAYKNYILDPWSASHGDHATGNFKNTSEWFANYLMSCIDPEVDFDGDQPGTYKPFEATGGNGPAALATTGTSTSIIEYACIGEDEDEPRTPTKRRRGGRGGSSTPPVNYCTVFEETTPLSTYTMENTGGTVVLSTVNMGGPSAGDNQSFDYIVDDLGGGADIFPNADKTVDGLYMSALNPAATYTLDMTGYNASGDLAIFFDNLGALAGAMFEITAVAGGSAVDMTTHFDEYAQVVRDGGTFTNPYVLNRTAATLTVTAPGGSQGKSLFLDNLPSDIETITVTHSTPSTLDAITMGLHDKTNRCDGTTPITPPTALVCDATTYIAQSPDAVTATTFKYLDTPTSTFIDIGDNSHGYTYNALGYNPTDNLVYAMNTGNNTDLLIIDASGAVTDLGPVAGLPTAPGSNNYGIGDFDAAGNYFITYGGGGTDLYQIDVNTKTLVNTIIMSTSVRLADIAYNPVDGLFYAVDTNTGDLLTIDSTTGTVVVIGATGVGSPAFGAMFADSLGEVRGVRNNGGYYTFDTTTGAATLLGSTSNVSFNDGAHCSGAPFDPAPTDPIAAITIDDTDMDAVLVEMTGTRNTASAFSAAADECLQVTATLKDGAAEPAITCGFLADGTALPDASAACTQADWDTIGVNAIAAGSTFNALTFEKNNDIDPALAFPIEFSLVAKQDAGAACAGGTDSAAVVATLDPYTIATFDNTAEGGHPAPTTAGTDPTYGAVNNVDNIYAVGGPEFVTDTAMLVNSSGESNTLWSVIGYTGNDYRIAETRLTGDPANTTAGATVTLPAGGTPGANHIGGEISTHVGAGTTQVNPVSVSSFYTDTVDYFGGHLGFTRLDRKVLEYVVIEMLTGPFANEFIKLQTATITR